MASVRCGESSSSRGWLRGIMLICINASFEKKFCKSFLNCRIFSLLKKDMFLSQRNSPDIKI